MKRLRERCLADKVDKKDINFKGEKTEKSISKKFRKLARMLHPDKNLDCEEDADEKFKYLQEERDRAVRGEEGQRKQKKREKREQRQAEEKQRQRQEEAKKVLEKVLSKSGKLSISKIKKLNDDGFKMVKEYYSSIKKRTQEETSNHLFVKEWYNWKFRGGKDFGEPEPKFEDYDISKWKTAGEEQPAEKKREAPEEKPQEKPQKSVSLTRYEIRFIKKLIGKMPPSPEEIREALEKRLEEIEKGEKSKTGIARRLEVSFENMGKLRDDIVIPKILKKL
jgi:curved DNA-binding protein CbpA